MFELSFVVLAVGVEPGFVPDVERDEFFLVCCLVDNGVVVDSDVVEVEDDCHTPL